MAKEISIQFINIYQAFVSPTLKLVLGTQSMCRFDETCSAYTKRQIKEKGVFRGTGLGFVRILKCQPLTS